MTHEEISREIRRLSWERAELARDMEALIRHGVYVRRETWEYIDRLTERMRELRLRLEALEEETGEA